MLLQHSITEQRVYEQPIYFPVDTKAKKSKTGALASAKGLSVASAKSIIRKRREKRGDAMREEEKQEDTQKRVKASFHGELTPVTASSHAQKARTS